MSFGFSLGRLCLMVIQPLSLGFILILNVVCISGLIGVVVFRWYGYIIFLIYVGGILVIFIYIISLVPNLIFLSSKVILYFFVIYFRYFLVNYIFMKEFISEEVKNNIVTNYRSIRCITSDIILIVDRFICYMLLGVVLLFVLISVVKICYYCEGPLRVFKFKYA